MDLAFKQNIRSNSNIKNESTSERKERKKVIESDLNSTIVVILSDVDRRCTRNYIEMIG